MTEILTESFCERCGTRYTFETVEQRTRPLGRLGTLGRGLKHFVVMPEASFDEAMAVARSEEEQRVSTAQLEVFHRTFNFCLSCRQYTCAECWNAVEGRCLSCAPMPVEETEFLVAQAILAPPILAAPILAPAVVPVTAPLTEPVPPRPASPTPVRAAHPAALDDALPDADERPAAVLAEPAAPEPAGEIEPEATLAEPPVEAAPMNAVAEPDVEAEPVLAPEPEPAAVAGPEPVLGIDIDIDATREIDVPGVEPGPFPGFQPGRSLDDEIAAYELRIAALAEVPPITEPFVPPAVDVVAATPMTPAPELPVPAPVAMAPVRLQAEPGVGARRARAITTTADVLNVPTPSAAAGTCRSCGLSLSASARFCRRCGTRQEA